MAATDDEKKPKLIPANDNPWYWLATLYGEQPEGDIDNDLAMKNRIAWNRWIAQGLSEAERAAWIEKGLNSAELTPFTSDEKEEHYRAFLARAGGKQLTLPDPDGPVDFLSHRFERRVSFEQYLFLRGTYFSKATFSGKVNFKSATFSWDVTFDSATFSSYADFESARSATVRFSSQQRSAGMRISA